MTHSSFVELSHDQKISNCEHYFNKFSIKFKITKFEIILELISRAILTLSIKIGSKIIFMEKNYNFVVINSRDNFKLFQTLQFRTFANKLSVGRQEQIKFVSILSHLFTPLQVNRKLNISSKIYLLSSIKVFNSD